MVRIWSALAVITGEQAMGIEIMESVGVKQRYARTESRASLESRRHSLIQKN
jgi:hypothetical protein